MAVKEITISRCQADEVGDLRRFIDEYWRRGHILARDEALLRWQYDPRRGRQADWPGPTVLVAKEDRRIVGMLGLILAEMNVRGRALPGAWLAVWLSLPEVRKHGVGLKLLDAAWNLAGCEAVFVIGINEQVKRIYAGLGYEILDEVPRYVAVGDPKPAAALMLSVDANADADSVEVHCDEIAVHENQDREGNQQVEAVAHPGLFDADWDAAWAERFAPTLIGTNRDSTYLNWRYVNHPSFDYERRVARDARSGELHGLAVFRVEQIRGREERVLRIVEFLATPEGGPPLAGAVTEAMRRHDVAFADFYCTCEKMAAPLEAVGFRVESHEAGRPVLPCRLQPLEGGVFKMMGAIRLAEEWRQRGGLMVPSGDLYVTKSDGDMDRAN
jgi:GNAT superfamily N-acetyltransferase